MVTVVPFTVKVGFVRVLVLVVENETGIPSTSVGAGDKVITYASTTPVSTNTCANVWRC